MSEELRHEDDYEPRQVAAAKRVIVDVMQVLASYEDCLVLVGGWVPDLVIGDAKEPHVGSIDVDLALDAAKLHDGRYAEMLKLLLGTTRYRQGEKEFQFVTEVDLRDGEKPVVVEVEFLVPKEVKTKKNKPKLLEATPHCFVGPGGASPAQEGERELKSVGRESCIRILID